MKTLLNPLRALGLVLLWAAQSMQAQPGSTVCNPIALGEIPSSFALEIADNNFGSGSEPDIWPDCGGGANSKFYFFRLPEGFTNVNVFLIPQETRVFQLALLDTAACFLPGAARFIPGTDDCAGAPGETLQIPDADVCLTNGGGFFLKVSGQTGSYLLRLRALLPTCDDGCVNGTETGTDSIAAPIIISSSADSSLCAGDLVFLQIAGATAYSSIVWDGIGAGSLITVNKPGVYIASVTDAAGCAGEGRIVLSYDIDCVWPGDADRNQTVQARDILPIGLAFNRTGPPRPVTGVPPLAFEGQTSPDWPMDLPGIYEGINLKFADSDGNGAINADDVLALTLNYGKQVPPSMPESGRWGEFSSRDGSRSSDGSSSRYASSSRYGSRSNSDGSRSDGSSSDTEWARASSTDPPLYIVFDQDSVEAGDTLRGSVLSGTALEPVSNLYGYGLNLTLPMAFIDSNYFELDFAPSWLDDDGDVSGFHQFVPTQGYVDVGYTRTDQTARSGSGVLFNFGVIVVDNLDGVRVTKTRKLPFNFQDLLALDVGADSVLLNPLPDTATAQEFCDSRGLSTVAEFIDAFRVNTRTVNSGNNGGYRFLTVNSNFLKAGSSYTFGFRPGYIGPATNQHWRAWLDVNADGDFDDPGELLVDQVRNGFFQRSITVPGSSAIGRTHLRIQMKRSDGVPPQPCEDFAFGEVEDFFVEIRPSGPRYGEEQRATLLVWPNPARDRIRIALPASAGLMDRLRLVNAQGQGLELQLPEPGSSATLDLSGLPRGWYTLQASGPQGVWTGKVVLLP